MKKALVLLLLLATMVSVAACGGGGGESADTSAADTYAAETTAELDALEARVLVADNLPEYDAGGRDFITVSYSEEAHYIMEEQTGDVVDDAIYERNTAVSERFNVNFDILLFNPYYEVRNYTKKCVNSGEDPFDLISTHVVDNGVSVIDGHFMNWYDVPHINFEQPWWYAANADLSYCGKAYQAVGYYALNTVAKTYCVFYNKRLGENYGIGNMYDSVYDGTWTIDKQIELTKDIYQDLNNDGGKDENDFYGFVSDPSSNVNTYLWAFENPIVAANKQGELEFVIKTEKLNNIIEKLNGMFENEKGCFTMKDNQHHGIGTSLFKEARAVFCNSTIGNAASTLREFEDDYAILPYPKWNEAQEQYHTMSDGAHHAMSVSICEQDLEFVGIITEALNAESWKRVVPVYYDVALKVKGTRDEESVGVLDILVSNCSFDFGYVYNGKSGASFWVQNLIQARSNDFESFYASKGPAVEEYYNKLFTFFEEA